MFLERNVGLVTPHSVQNDSVKNFPNSIWTKTKHVPKLIIHENCDFIKSEVWGKWKDVWFCGQSTNPKKPIQTPRITFSVFILRWNIDFPNYRHFYFRKTCILRKNVQMVCIESVDVPGRGAKYLSWMLCSL